MNASSQTFETSSIAVAIPCFNEASTIQKVVSDFGEALPQARLYVFDNNSTDGTAELARAAGATVFRENRQGKGYVLQAIFEKVEADILIIVDGDDTYPAEEVHKLLDPILHEEADMVVGTRLENARRAVLRRLNRCGNRIISSVINFLFDTRFSDVLSGYRAFSSRFLKQIPIVGGGFETEVELTIQTLTQALTIREVPITYRRRPHGSNSKLRPFSDGYRILLTIIVLLRDLRPLVAFGTLGIAALTVGSMAGVLRLLTYLGTATLPIALLSGVLIWMTLLGIALFVVGLVLNAINTRFREMSSLMRRLR